MEDRIKLDVREIISIIRDEFDHGNRSIQTQMLITPSQFDTFNILSVHYL